MPLSICETSWASDFFRTAVWRHQIYHSRHVQGNPPPWTDIEVFRRWRFCNVFRELDRTTAWFRENVRDHVAEDPWRSIFACMLFRWFNRIETGEKIKGALRRGRWKPDELRTNLNNHAPLLTGAYIIKTPPAMKKLEGIIWCMEQAVPQIDALVQLHHFNQWSLHDLWIHLREFPYLGPFMAYEIVSDLRWTCVGRDAPDITTWANAGPGAARGLAWVWGTKPGTKLYTYTSDIDQQRMNTDMCDLLSMSRSAEHWPKAWPRWEMREVEHWLCEYDKYRRASLGFRLKNKFQEPIAH